MYPDDADSWLRMPSFAIILRVIGIRSIAADKKPLTYIPRGGGVHRTDG
jgi:hypothetical protein